MTTPPIVPPPPDGLPKVGDELSRESQSLYERIAAQPFFEGLTPPQLKLLAAAALEMQFATGQEIMHEGSPANRFYLILEGQVALETQLEGRGVFPIQTLGPGDDLGWSWLFPPYLFHLSARALTPTRAIFFYATRLREQCEQDDALSLQLMRRVAAVLIQRLHVTQQRLTECIVTNKLSNL